MAMELGQESHVWTPRDDAFASDVLEWYVRNRIAAGFGWSETIDKRALNYTCEVFTIGDYRPPWEVSITIACILSDQVAGQGLFRHFSGLQERIVPRET